MSALKSITLPDGVIKYTLDDWIGYRQPGQPMLKTKWRKTNIEYWEFPNSKNNNVYTVQKDNMNIFSCDCPGYRFHRKCRHIVAIKNGEV
tara:strand:+ start:502 stop:771 length:270 start_codon:yes stop_codon:yes gene_type:complete